MIGQGALKYFILKVDPRKTMLFDPKESIDFNGNTGPFIQYTHARIRSILRKAAERGFKDRHWIRVELQLRDERATAAALELVKLSDIGATVSGILRNYLMFRVPSLDSNKSRWPVALWWEYMLENMEKIKLWVSPGEPYNFDNTEYWFFKQYGQAIAVMDQLHDPFYITDKAKALFPNYNLAPKYQRYLAQFDLKPRDFVDEPNVFDWEQLILEV